MSDPLDLVTLLQNLSAGLTAANEAVVALQAQLVDAQAAADASAKLAHDTGFSEGVASVVINPDLKFTQADLDKAFQDGVKSVGGTFTQADLDAAVKNAVDPLNLQIAGLQSTVDGIPTVLESQKSGLKSAFKDLLKAGESTEESQVDAL